MKATKSLLLSILMLCTLPAFAQPDWLWARSGVGLEYDQASAVTTDPFGNVIATGYYSSDSISFGGITLHNNTPGFSDLCIVKYDPNGNVLWARSAGGGFDDKGSSVATDAIGNVYMTGNFYSATITFGTFTLVNAGNVGDICIVKYDPNGNVLWATREGGAGLEIPYSIVVDNTGGIIVAGRFSSTTITFGTTTLLQAGSMDVFVVKYNAAGTVLWAKGAGGGTNDEAYALAVDAAGDIIVAGYYTQNADFGTITLSNPGQANIFLAKCDGATGNFLWAKSTGSNGDERALAISLDALDNIYAAGFFQSDSLVFGSTTLYSTGIDNGYIARFDSDGDPVWAHGLDGRSKAQGIAVANNAVYACGVFRNDSLNYGPYLLLLEGSSDLFLLKSDLNGNAQWAAKQTADGGSSESALAMAADLTGKLVIAGNFNSDVTTFGSAQLVNSDGFDFFVVKTGDQDVGVGEVVNAEGVIISPNPGSGSFALSGIPAGTRRIEVCDALGAVVYREDVPRDQGQLVLDLSRSRPGLYHLRMIAGGHQVVKKLVVEE